LENKKAKCGVIEMSEYDLKKSEKIGQLYPVLVDAKGNVIDGFHRLEADSSWRREKLPEIDTEEKLLVARCVANWHRRQVSGEEKEEWINSLARIYKEQGLSSEGHRNEIKLKISEVTGLHPDTVLLYLHDKYKGELPYPIEERHPTVLASQRIKKSLGISVVERHREEVEQELRPRIESEVRERIIEEEIKPKVKEELSRDVEFIREAIEKAPEVLPTLPEETIERARKLVEPKEMGVKEGIVYTVGEYECPNCKRHYWIRCNGKKDWVE
jgi:hypothetical protein